MTAACDGTYFPRTWEVEARGSEIPDQPQQLSEFEASWGYMRLCIKQANK